MHKKIEREKIDSIISMTNTQLGILYHCLKSNDSNMYTIQSKIDIEGTLNIEKFYEALKNVLNDNEILRSSFRWENVKKPLCMVLKQEKLPFTMYNYSWGNDHDFTQYVDSICNKMFKKGIKLDEDSLIEFVLIQKSKNQYTLIIQYHHIIMDGWSLGNLVERIFNYYDDKKQDNDSLNRFKYTEYIKSVKGKNFDESNEYWKEYLEDFENNYDLEIKSDENFGDLKQGKHKFSFNMYKDDDYYLKKLLSTNGILLSSFIYSMWSILLHKYTAEEDILFGTVVSGRDIDVPGVMDAIGFFSNTIPCRNKIDRNEKFIDFLASVNEDQIKVTQHNLTPLNHIKKCSNLNSIEDLFSTLVVIENYPIPNMNASINIKSVEVIEQNNFPIILGVFKKENIEFELEYDSKKYSMNTIKRLANHIQNIIHSIVRNNEILIKDIEILSEDEKRKLIKDFNSTEMEFPRETTVGMLISNQAKITPELIAIRFDEKEITYKDLDRVSSILSNKILEKGVKQGDVVCIIMDTSIEAISSMIAVMKSGAAFLPVDIKYPKERINEIKKQNNSKVIITTKKFYNKLEFNIEECIFVDELDNKGLERVNYSTSRDLAYLIATSGTTGKPKSIMVKNESFTDFVCWVKEAYEYKEGTQGSLSLPFAFDSALLQIFPPLISGGTLNLIDPEQRKNPKYYLNYLKKSNINVIDEIPTVMNILFDYIEQEQLYNDEQLLPNLICISLGSEYVPIEVARKCRKYLNHEGKIVNAYGPAETSVVVTTYLFDEKVETNKFLIGKPRFNTKVYITNKYGELCPIGVPGELCVSGVCVAKGYYNDFEKTNEKFVDNVFSCEKNYERMYKTGDKAYWMDDGNIDFLGRIDNQIKYHGYRIELEEIEKRLQNVFKSKNIVVVDKMINNFKTVVAYIETSEELELNKVKSELSGKLPNYMIPSKFITIESLPKNANGKIDRSRLRQMKDLVAKNNNISINTNKTDNQMTAVIRNIWASILGHENFTENDNFYDVGGDSITLVNMYMQLKKEFRNVEIDISDLFSYTTVDEIVQYYMSKQSEQLIAPVNANMKEANFDSNNDIAIIGMAGRFPKARNIFEFWENLCSKVDCISDISQERIAFDLNGYENKKYLKWGYMDGVDKFDPLFFKISPKVAVNMDPHHRQMLEVAYLAIENSGYFSDVNSSKNVGVFMGAVMPTYMNYVKNVAIDELLSTNLPANIAGRVAYHMGFQGPTVTIDTACSSSLVSLHYAVSSLRNKECDMAIAGGAYIQIDPLEYEYALKSGIVSPTQHCNAFSSNADGTIGGEGCVAVVLKPLNEAIKDNDYIYSVIKGSAINHDGDRSNGITAPNSDAQAECIRKAWNDSKVSPETISFIESHGTGTKLGDPIEISGLQKAFIGSDVANQSIPIGSLKTNIGHLDSVSGLAGVIKTAMSLNRKMIVPTLNYISSNPYINFETSPVYVENKLIDWIKPKSGIRRAGISSFGLSGTNCHVVLEEYINDIEQHDDNFKRSELIVFSGNDERVLVNQLKLAQDYLKKDKTVSLKDLSYTLGVARKSFKNRKSFVVSSKKELLQEIEVYLQNGKTDKKQKIKIHDIGIIMGNIKVDKFRNFTNYNLDEIHKKYLNTIDNNVQRDIFKNYLYIINLFINIGFNEKNLMNDKLSQLVFSIINNDEISIDDLKTCLYQYELKEVSINKDNTRDYKLIIVIEDKDRNNLEICDEYSQQLFINEDSFEKDILNLIAKLYEYGVDFNLKKILEGRVIPLPSEPFKKESYWVEIEKKRKEVIINNDFEKSVEVINSKNLLYGIEWRKIQDAKKILKSEELKEKTILVIRNKDNCYDQLVNSLQNSCKHLITITLGDEFKKKSNNEYEISFIEEQHYKMVFQDIAEEYKTIDYQFVLLNDSSSVFKHGYLEQHNVEMMLKQLILSCVYIFKYLNQSFSEKNINNYFITQRACMILDDDPIISPYLNMVFSINRTINQEVSNVKSCIIDIDEAMIQNKDNSHIDLLRVVCGNNNGVQLCYRNRDIYLPYLYKKDYKSLNLVDQIKDGGIYVITGGIGGIGVEITKHISKRENVKLFLISKSKINLDDKYQEQINGVDLNKMKNIETIKELRNRGHHIEILNADVSDYKEMKNAISYIEEGFGEVNGIIHAAGILGNKKTFINSIWNDFDKVFKSKIYGLMVLEKLFRNKFLDFFVSFSSIDAYLSKDMSSYSCANAFLDSFSVMNRQIGRKSISINWGSWKNIGMNVGANVQEKSNIFNNIAKLKNITISQLGLNVADALSSFDVILASNDNSVLVTELDNNDINNIKETNFYKIDELINLNHDTQISNLDIQNISIYDVKKQVEEIWKKRLELKEIDENESFYTYGGDSISGIEIMLELSNLYAVKLEVSILFEHDTVVELSNYILRLLKENKENQKKVIIPKAKPIN